MPPLFHSLLIEEVVRETADAVVLRFAVPDNLREAYRFLPGQYLTLRATIEGEDLRRSYSICSPPGAALAVGIRRVDDGVFSGWANHALNAGDTIDVMTPDGRFGLPPPLPSGRTVAAFVAGSGITPIVSILHDVLAAEPNSRCFLFYGNRSTASIMFRGTLEDLKDRYLSRLSVFHVISREQQDVPVLHGRLDGDKVRLLLHALLPAATIDQALVCGPPHMIDELPAVLAELGVLAECIHVERFTPAEAGRRPRVPSPAAVIAPAAIATVISEGVSADLAMLAGETIIDAAQRTGRSLPFSCRGGMCCTCRARLVEGRAVMAANYSLEPWEVDAGFVLTCQATPLTPRIVVDFDQV